MPNETHVARWVLTGTPQVLPVDFAVRALRESSVHAAETRLVSVLQRQTLHPHSEPPGAAGQAFVVEGRSAKSGMFMRLVVTAAGTVAATLTERLRRPMFHTEQIADIRLASLLSLVFGTLTDLDATGRSLFHVALDVTPTAPGADHTITLGSANRGYAMSTVQSLEWNGELLLPVSETSEDRRARKVIRRNWEEAGRPPCVVCGAPIEHDSNVSLLWRAVVHSLCVRAKVVRPSPAAMEREPCPFYLDCPIVFHARDHESCVCPHDSALNAVFVARRLGQSTVRIPTAFSPAAARAARDAGLGEHYRGVPLREIPRLDHVREHGTLAPGVDERVWDEPTNVCEPPEYLTVDIEPTFAAGRVITAETSRGLAPSGRYVR